MGVRRSVVAIGLDAASLPLLDAWIAAGHLPALARLRQRSARARLAGPEICRAEVPWTCFLTGCEPEQTGYWHVLRFSPEDYGMTEPSAYDFAEAPPFYAVGGGRRVGVFDVPQSRLADDVNGLQVIAWGAHSPLAPRGSQPPGLLAEIDARFGNHPAFLRDEATLWRPHELDRLEELLIVGIQRRAEICADLIGREPWDLFLTAFGETHSAGHYLWHRSQPDHPLYEDVGRDPLLRVYQSIDRAVERMVACVSTDTCVAVFATHGMETNCMDLPGMVVLPEMLYRMNFPGRRTIGNAGAEDGPIPPPLRPRRAWVPAVWGTEGGVGPLRRSLRQELPSALVYRLDRLWPSTAESLSSPADAGSLSYQPAMWYRRLWPRMRAFALPTFSEGYVRINVRGREAAGVVDPSEYERVCDEVTAEIEGLTDARSGAPIVLEVRRTRNSPHADGRLPDPDLIVRWRPGATDVVDGPTTGRIGPLPYARAGSHTEEGFLWLSGAGIEAGKELPDGRPTSLAPTFLALMDATVPQHMHQAPLLPT